MRRRLSAAVALLVFASACGSKDEDPCAAQDARPMTTDAAFNGLVSRWHWNGKACDVRQYAVPFMDTLPTCAGKDCDSLPAAAEDCVESYAACGAVRELPMRGQAFEGVAEAGVVCGPTSDGVREVCAVGQECGLVIAANCHAPDATEPYRVRCDDAADCGDGLTCCISERDGFYLVSSCRTSCDAATEAAACSSDNDCGSNEHCCIAHPSQPGFGLSDFASIGVCTDHPCVASDNE